MIAEDRDSTKPKLLSETFVLPAIDAAVEEAP